MRNIDFLLEAMTNAFVVDYVQAYGRYRIKVRLRVIYDAMLVAWRNGRPYLTRLGPLPE
jgi:hypothetical protein